MSVHPATPNGVKASCTHDVNDPLLCHRLKPHTMFQAEEQKFEANIAQAVHLSVNTTPLLNSASQ
ncbi:hypothetical protein WG66_004989 [Moniliophthora roreri]|nr:hypothetical protein WG66_004989 [Moniliophthora roreri]